MKMNTAHISTQSTLHSIVFYLVRSFTGLQNERKMPSFTSGSWCQEKAEPGSHFSQKKCNLPVHVLPSTLSTDPSGQKQTGPLDVWRQP